MTYWNCNECKLRKIAGNEEVCKACGGKYFSTVYSDRVWQERDFSQIKRGAVYGGNSRTIFEKFCDTLGWDRSKATQFGWQTPLYTGVYKLVKNDTTRIYERISDIYPFEQ